MSVRGVDDEGVHTGLDECVSALPRIRAHPDRRGHAQAATRVLRRGRELDFLLNVLDRDQSAKPPLGIDDGQLLDLVPVQDRLCFRECRPDGRSHEVARGHQRPHRLRRVRREPQIAVRQDPEQLAFVVRDRNPGDVVGRHQLERGRHRCIGRQGDGLDDHPRLRALDLVDLRDLILDREVPVEDADPALTGERDREPGLRDRVHRRGHDRDRELDAARQTCPGRDVVREDARLRGNEEHVVEGEPFPRELSIELDKPLEFCLVEVQTLHRSMVPAASDEPGPRSS